MSTHIPEERLEQYAAGHTLPEDQLVEVEEHLLVCFACQDRLGEMDNYVANIREALLVIDGRR